MSMLRIDEYRMARMVPMAEVSGATGSGSTEVRWLDDVKVVLSSRGITMEAAG